MVWLFYSNCSDVCTSRTDSAGSCSELSCSTCLVQSTRSRLKKPAITTGFSYLYTTPRGADVAACASRASHSEKPAAIIFQFLAALLQLRLVVALLLFHFARHLYQPRLAEMGAATIVATTFVVGQILTAPRTQSARPPQHVLQYAHLLAADTISLVCRTLSSRSP